MGNKHVEWHEILSHKYEENAIFIQFSLNNIHSVWEYMINYTIKKTKTSVCSLIWTRLSLPSQQIGSQKLEVNMKLQSNWSRKHNEIRRGFKKKKGKVTTVNLQAYG